MIFPSFHNDILGLHDVFDGDILDSVDCVGVSDGVDGVVDTVDGGAGDSCCLWFDLRTESSLRAAKTHKKRGSRVEKNGLVDKTLRTQKNGLDWISEAREAGKMAEGESLQ